MCNLQVSVEIRPESGFSAGQAVAMAYQLVPGVEILYAIADGRRMFQTGRDLRLTERQKNLISGFQVNRGPLF